MSTELPKDVSDLPGFFGTTENRLQYHLINKAFFYRQIEVPKKAGGTRKILAPENPLKAWQYLILEALTAVYRPYAVVHAYAPDRSFVTNAQKHVRCRLIVKADLRDFFGHIHKNRIRGIFCSSVIGADPTAGDILARICTIDDELPAGAPTSPILSNLICRSLDRSLVSMARDIGAFYSRYADDLTFSFKRQRVPPSQIAVIQRGEWTPGRELRRAIQQEGFVINDEKFRVLPDHQRQMVTGVIVNAKKNVKKDVLKRIRAILWNISRNGYEHEEKKLHAEIGPRKAKLKDFLRGKINYIRQVRGDDDFLSIRLGRSFNKAFGECAFISAIGPSCLSRSDEINPAIFRLNAEFPGGAIGDGTAFAVSSRHIITCAHVVMPDGMSESELLRKWDSMNVTGISADGTTISVSQIVGLCRSQDLALLEIAEKLDVHFRISSKTVNYGEELALFGYGRIGGFAQEPRALRTNVSSISPLGGVRYLQSANSILTGDSGGPAVGMDGRIVGVCARAESSELIANAIVSTQNRFFAEECRALKILD